MRVCPRSPRCPNPPPRQSVRTPCRGDARRRGRERALRRRGGRRSRTASVLHAAGDPYTLTFTRSALKPLQALPFAAGGGVERFGYRAGAGGADVRQPLRRAAPRRSGGGHARAGRVLARPTCSAARMRRASTTRAARCRRRRRIRRCSTTAPASTAACSPGASSAAHRHDDYLAYRPSAAAGDPPGGRALHGGRRRTRLVAGHRRLLGAELRGAAGVARARRSRGSRAPMSTRITERRRARWPTR